MDCRVVCRSSRYAGYILTKDVEILTISATGSSDYAASDLLAFALVSSALTLSKRGAGDRVATLRNLAQFQQDIVESIETAPGALQALPSTAGADERLDQVHELSDICFQRSTVLEEPSPALPSLGRLSTSSPSNRKSPTERSTESLKPPRRTGTPRLSKVVKHKRISHFIKTRSRDCRRDWFSLLLSNAKRCIYLVY